MTEDKKIPCIIVINMSNQERAELLLKALMRLGSQLIEGEDLHMFADKDVKPSNELFECGYLGKGDTTYTLSHNMPLENARMNDVIEYLKTAQEIQETLLARCRWDCNDENEYGELCTELWSCLSQLEYLLIPE